MAVATSKRTQTNFDVNAVWQYLTWKNVVWILENVERRAMRVCRAWWWTVEWFLFCARSKGAVLTTRCLGVSRVSAGASSSCSTCKTVPNTTPCFWNPPSGWKERKEDVGGWVGRSRKGNATQLWASECVCKTFNLYSRLTFTVRNCPSALKQQVNNN